MAQAHKAECLNSFILASVPQPGSLSLAINFQVYLLFFPRFVGSTEMVSVAAEHCNTSMLWFLCTIQFREVKLPSPLPVAT